MEQSENILVTFGGWYQRTTLHLSEVQGFLKEAESKLDLSQTKLKKLHQNLDIESVNRELGLFEYLSVKTKSGIEFRYYEDGLYILEKRSKDIELASRELNDYYDQKLSPALNYLFSLGAPTPKILADIKISHAVVVSVVDEDPANYEFDQNRFGQIYSKIFSKGISVYKSIEYIFIVTDHNLDNVRQLVETQIFFREFKDQLGRYLNIHRIIWEEIEEIKEKRAIRGIEVEDVRIKLDSYQKTISLISNRIGQMSTYASTRRSIAQKTEIEDYLQDLFQYRFEVLFDTLEYIKQIWAMTNDYLSQALSVITDIRNNALNSNISSVRAIMVLGIMGMVVGTAQATLYPKITQTGVIYLLGLIVFTVLLDTLISWFFKLKIYKLKFIEGQREFK